MDGAGGSRSRQIWIHQEVSEEVTVEEYGHVRPRDDHPRGTYRLATPSSLATQSYLSPVGDDRPPTFRAYQQGCHGHAGSLEWEPT